MTIRTAIGQLQSPAQEDVADIIYAVLDDHPAWEFVGKYSSDNYWVWKCLGTENSLGQDFYYLVQVGVRDFFQFRIAEGFNTSTGEVLNPAVQGGANNADGGRGTLAVTSSTLWINSSTGGGHNHAILGDTVRYVVNATEERLVLGINEHMLYAGTYDSQMWAFPDYPLCQGNSGSAASFAYTRHPGREEQSANGHHRQGEWTVPYRSWSHRYPGALSPYWGDKGVLRPVRCYGYSSSASNLLIYGQVRGTLHGLWSLYADTGFLTGDTFKDADDNRYVVTGVASFGQDYFLVPTESS